MEAWQILSLAAGVAVALGVLLDMFLTVLHHDSSGWLVPRIQDGVWWMSVALGRRLPRARRRALALAGPLMIAATLVVWFSGYILGFSLIYWPSLGGFRAEPELGELGFLQALYYSGSTGTVLGLGDISPTDPALQVVTYIQAGFGFVLVTGSVTYLLSIVGIAVSRNAIAVRLILDTAQTGDGVRALERWLAGGEEATAIAARLRSLARGLSELEEELNQIPIAGLHYRAADPARDTERMLRAAAGIAIAARVASQGGRYAPIAVAAEDVALAVTRIASLIAERHLPDAARRACADGMATPQDHERLQAVHERLAVWLGDVATRPEKPDPVALATAARIRVFLAALDEVTGWRTDGD
jgi:hypothetical protein